ncbi:MAG: PEGA domain-containing protein [Planctomycetes bacterium]|jgi:hypothetical protein|nr:PEGA domain-containing protein [Planctomycetota bacterium]HNZ66574.1 PEGA domain-containing protein [Planctomycetota bacterium]HON43991.1 PEGA domain-containing protein [Planctomycetota bacterium]HPY75480.1 PEGA domain-containing protein [Planctomycetota bacterium]HRU51999.1 PEGA domain-containing protein [Planctomycetota bacterium]
MTRINIILIFCILICGCVERKITITTDPPGAFVWLDGKKIGKTPLETPFIFHGTREITLQKKGYEIQSNMEPISIPWFQLFPIDFFTEFCCPFTFKDEHTFHYTLIPQLNKTDKAKTELMHRANTFKQEIDQLINKQEIDNNHQTDKAKTE